MNIARLLQERAAASGEVPAIIDGSSGRTRTMTFAGLERASAGAAARLRAAGLRPGDTVLILVPMCAELYSSLNAMFRLGLVAMFLDPSAGRDHIEACCAQCPPRAFIGSPRAHWLRLVSPALRRIPLRFCAGGTVPGALSLAGWGSEPVEEYVEPRAVDAPAMLRFTSGGTGPPKASVRTHRFLLEQHRVLERSLRLAAGEVDLATLPIFVLANLASGVTSLIPPGELRAPGRIRPWPVIRQIESCRPERLSASPAFLERLAEVCLPAGRSLDSLRKVFTGGAPVFPDQMERFQRLAPGAQIVAVYGSTEAEPIAQVRREDISEEDRAAMWAGRGLLAGLPDPAIRLRILGDPGRPSGGPLNEAQLNERTLPPGEPGEIVVSGPHVQPGYLHESGDEETKLRVNGTTWHRTGDAGYLDTRGRLWLLGRQGARIRDERGTLYPFQVECAAQRNAGVRRAALVAGRGGRLLAVEPRSELDPRQLEAELAWAGIDRVTLVRRLPLDRRHNAKIDYVALRRMFSLDRRRGAQLNRE